MADTDITTRLVQDRNVWLGTVRPDGRSHLIPVWFVFVDDSFWIGTGAASVKTMNILERPHASVALEDGDNPVCAQGRAVVHPHERPPAVVDAFMAKYGWDVTRPDDADVGVLVLLQIHADNWLFGDPNATRGA